MGKRNITPVSRLEVSIMRLLKKCELLAKENIEDWKFEKYVDSLDAFITQLSSNDKPPNNNILDKYRRRVEYLKGVLEAKKMTSTIEKVIATQLLLPVSVTEESKEVLEMHRTLVVQSENELREELFQGSYCEELNSTRKRTGVSVIDAAEDGNVESVIDFYKLKQEKISQDMLVISRNMREQSELAGRIIKQDIKVLGKSTDVMDKNEVHLQKSSTRLEMLIAKSGWNFLIWIMLAVVVIVFINMILFMKMFKKRY